MRRILLAVTILAVSFAGSASASSPAFTCQLNHYYFNESGSYEISFANLDKGNKQRMVMCVQRRDGKGARGNCKDILNWKKGDSWTTNVEAGDHLQIWQSEYSDNHANSDSKGECESGGTYAAARYTSTGGMDVSLKAKKL